MGKKIKITDLDADMLDSIKSRRAGGATVDEVAADLGITRRTLDYWRKKNPDLDRVMNEAKTITLTHLGLTATEALLRKLVSREQTETTVVTYTDASGKLTKTQTTTKTKTVEPSDALIMYALPRISPEIWDSLAVKRLEQGADDSGDYTELIDKILGKSPTKEATP